jgi:hypothetical protein
MKLILLKNVVGIKNRGLDNEENITHAYKGDAVNVAYKRRTHYICEKEGVEFIVFPSQVEHILEDIREDITFDNYQEPLYNIDDLFYSDYTEEPEIFW